MGELSPDVPFLSLLVPHVFQTDPQATSRIKTEGRTR